MSNKTQNIKSYKIIYPQIYSYILPNRDQNKGSQKIGYTERKNVDERIKEQVKTAAFTEAYNKLWSAPAFFEDNKESFTDKDFHNFLVKNNIIKRDDLGTEWFYFNGFPEKSKILFDLFRRESFSALQNNKGKVDYTLRFEQEEAVQKALKYFNNHEKSEFLWNAKPRFGKTLASYDLAKRLEANKVLIVTNRPAIANSWFDDYEKFIDGYAFISETSSLSNRPIITREQHIKQNPLKPQITFLSLQDLKGSKYFGGNYEKLRWIADLEWDLLIIDEAHEGVDTTRTDAAFDVIKRKHTLHLSGTPFKALANEKFPQEAIFNWTYLDEQQMKHIELEEGETGEHTNLPDLRLFTYRISQMITDQVNKGVEINDETHDYAFDLNEFFRAKNRRFVYEEEVKAFLRNLSTNKKYPFSTPELREELKHTFWYVGNRVESVKALETLLKKDPIFKDYKVIIAAGDGRTFEEEDRDFKANESSFEKVKKAIAENDKTITLSCGQLTTGVTIKEWTAVLMLTDIKSPSLYMQAAFRAQNPFKKLKNGKLLIKKSAYLFDFAPTRVLEIYDDFANGLNPKAVSGEITEKDREENIQELLNFFPVISEDVNGEMIELDANQVLTFPNALAATEIVNARFMTNLLFNDSLKGVFNFPKEVEEILDKLPEEKNKRIRQTKNNLGLEDAKETYKNKTKNTNQNTDIILGKRIYQPNIKREVENSLSQDKQQINTNELVEKVNQVAEPLIAKYKAIYKATQAETKEVAKQIQEQVKEIAAEYNSSEIKDSEALKQKIIDTIELDFVTNKVTQKEEEKVEKVQKTKEEEIKDRLRSFTRTIPMFIMANDSKKEITIDNFDTEIDDKDFLEITNITKEEFHKLRDGFDYEENGKRKTFHGVFNKYRFNASIAEFRLKKEQLANYFTAKEDIFELIPNQKNNQIFTPKKVVQMMINNLEEHAPDLFTRTDSTFIDLYMKSGMYITEIVKKLFHNTRDQYKSDKNCLKHILENQVFGLSPTPILQGITQSYIFGFDTENKISRQNFIQHDLTPEAKENKAKEKLQELFKLKENMKFDAVVGNPPYQENISSNKGNTSLSRQLYPIFIQNSIFLDSNYLSLITPSRWFTANAQDRSFIKLREFIKENNHITKIVNYPDSKLLFNNVEIAGGVNYFLYDKLNSDGRVEFTECYNESINTSIRPLFEEGLDIIISMNQLVNILDKVKSYKDFIPMTDITYGRNAFGVVGKVSVLNKITTEEYFDNAIEVRCAYEQIRYIEKSSITKNVELVDKWKVFTSKANGGAGVLSDDGVVAIIGKAYIGKPQSICTDSLIPIGSFNTEIEATNLQKYMTGKFLRFMVGILKVSQNLYQNVYQFVPLQDFTDESDIDWSKSIKEIDQQLYKKYELSEDEIAFIEEKVQPMD